MESFFKKFGIFIILGIALIILLVSHFLKPPTDKLKKYLVTQGFYYYSNSELQKENISLEEYEKNGNSYNLEAFDFNESDFNLINKEKIDSFENIYTITFNIVTGRLVGSYKKVNEYDTWYIDGNIDITNDKFTCDTAGFKGLNGYCEILRTKMTEFKNKVNIYLAQSNTDEYYIKKMYE